MIYFSPDFLQFFKELAANNHKEWFDENRKRYEKEVKEPFKKLVADVILEMRKEEPELLVEPKDCIFRINRDIRFSKDKTPYKTNVSAAISPGGRKDMTTPGLYLELGPERLAIYGGMYMPDTKLLKQLRTYITENLVGFKQAYQDDSFVKHYGELHGEQNKRIDKEFREAAEMEPLLYNKQFYYYAILPEEMIVADNLLEMVTEYYDAGRPMREFLWDAVLS
jgi:uncharacterized protein (TIGR02453 family)